jgi:TetR/AcrR family transcriptional regulator, cholesterol catabolism regulator
MNNPTTNMAKHFPAEPVDPRARVLVSAANLFISDGFNATSTDAIAKAADLKPAALYRLFDSKEHILYCFLETLTEAFLADVKAAIGTDEDPAVRLARLVWSHTHIMLRADGVVTRGYVRTFYSISQLMTSLSAERERHLRDLARIHLDTCRGIIDEGMESGRFKVPDSRSAAYAVTTICEFSPLWFHAEKGLSVEQVADRFALYAMRAVAVEEEDLPLFVQGACRATTTIAA